MLSGFYGTERFVDGRKQTVSDICYICKTSITQDKLIGVPDNCDHGFHLTCIEGWINKGNRSCPECGVQFDKIIKTPFEKK
jgi:hypothetical protein